MLLTFLSRSMASLLTTLLFITVVGVTADHTILNTPYIENKLESQQAYDRLSVALSNDISDNAVTAAIPESVVNAGLKQVLTPDVLRVKINSTLSQLQAYYRGDGPVPTVDISDLVQRAQQSGIPIDAGKYNQPVKLTAATKAKQVSDIAKYVTIGLLALIGVLFAAIAAIAIKRRDFRPFANIVFSLGLMLSISGGLLLFVPSVFSRLYKFDPVTNPFGTLAHDLAISAIHDFGLRLMIPGVVALLVGILAKFTLRARRRKQHETKQVNENKFEMGKPFTPVSMSSGSAVERTESLGFGQPLQPAAISDSPRAPLADSSSGVSQGESVPGAPPRPGLSDKPRKIQL